MNLSYTLWKFYCAGKLIVNCIVSSGGIQFDATENATLLINTENKPTKHVGMFSLYCGKKQK